MNWDYVAGFFDGEGSVTIRRNKSPTLRFGNTDREVLESLQRFIGFGHISSWSPPNGWKTYYQLSFANRQLLLRIGKRLVNRCIIKRQKLLTLLAFMQANPVKKKFRLYTRPAHLTPELLRELYMDKRLSGRQIAVMSGCSSCTVFRRMQKFRIPARTVGEGVSISRRNGIYGNLRHQGELRGQATAPT